MSEWSDKERAFLESAKKEWGPAPGVAAAVRAGVAKRVEAPAPPPSGIGTKGIAAIVGAGVIVGVLVWLGTRHEGPQTPPPPPQPSVMTPPPAIDPPKAPEAVSISVDSLPNAPLPRVTATPAPSASADTLAEELVLLRSAQTSLRSGAPNDALTALHTHATRFPRGVLREERMTLEVLALCDAGRVAEARTARAALVAAAPGSSHLERLDNSCAVKP